MRGTKFIPMFLLVLVLGGTGVAQDSRPPVTADVFFKGTVEKFKARRIALSYDFADEEALGDFTRVNPFLAQPKGAFDVRNGVLDLDGIGALMHKGVFEADVVVTLTLKSKKPEDLGVLLLQPGLTETFLLFGLADTFFSEKDRQTPRQHMITVVGADDGGSDDEALFRYLKRAKTPVIKGGEIEVEVRKKNARNRFTFGKTYIDAEDRYGRFPNVQPALYVLNSAMTVSRLTIAGKLSRDWLVKNRIAFDPKETDDEDVAEIKPPEGGVVPVPSEDEGRGRGRGRDWGRNRGGGSETADLIRKIGDSRGDKKEREKAVKEIKKENVKEAEFKALLALLLSDDLTTRTLTIKVLKNITGKTLGYNPKAREKDRKNSHREWYRYFMRNCERFED